MLARVATFDPLPEGLDPEAVALLRKTIRETPGFVAGYHVGAAGRKSLSITFFEDADAARAAGAALAARPADGRVGIEPDQVEFFDAEPF
ncbi:MAG TPA: hypothetical protein VH418_03925 [Solirubrobacteraceae bacterium]